MRIVYVLNSLGVGGTERQILALADRMVMHGHAVALLVLRAAEPDDLPTQLEVMRLDMRKSVWSFFAGLRRGAAFLRRFRPDVIHSNNFHGNLLSRLMRLLCPAPALIATIHNVYEGAWPRMLAYRLSDGLCTLTTAVSSAAAERYIRLKAVPGNKCVVLANGIDAAEFMPDAKRRAAMRNKMGVSEEFVWLAVGRVTPAKDFPNLMQAFGRVWIASPLAQLWIAGGDGSHGLSAAKHGDDGLCLAHGAMDHVRMLGVRDDIPALLDAADGLVLSSAWEGMPLALGEAMAMRKPVVATDVGGVRELVGDAGLVVPAKNFEALAEGMLSVMRLSLEDRMETGRAARERICQSFNMDVKAEEWESLYRLVLR